jgi:hypothetical protein
MDPRNAAPARESVASSAQQLLNFQRAPRLDGVRKQSAAAGTLGLRRRCVSAHLRKFRSSCQRGSEEPQNSATGALRARSNS